MSTFIYDGNIYQGAVEQHIAAPVSQLLTSINIGSSKVGSVTATITSNGVYGVVTPSVRNPELDITFDCQSNDSAGNTDQGKLVATAEIFGDWSNIVIAVDVFIGTTTLLGTYVSGILATGLFTFTLKLKPDEDFIPFVSSTKSNWIKWSDVGSLSFTIGRGNVAGERPLDWKGYVYAIKKLGTKAVVYGENGVSILTPSGTTFGLSTVYRVGLKGKHAVAGDESKHFFVDNTGQLWKLSDGLNRLDYSEYLSKMNESIILTYDNLLNVVYICDGSVGYIYDVVTGNLGTCSPNITGIGYQSGVQYVTASSSITTDPFEICTDIYDLGVRAGKSIFSLEFGTDLETGLYAAIEYRRSMSDDFLRTPWYSVSSIGRVFITAWGREFRFRVKTLTYEAFELDYITVNGVANAY